jgi:hypothetical protein
VNVPETAPLYWPDHVPPSFNGRVAACDPEDLIPAIALPLEPIARRVAARTVVTNLVLALIEMTPLRPVFAPQASIGRSLTSRQAPETPEG